MHPIKRFFRLLKLDKKDITYIYIYAIFAGLIALSLPLGVQAIIGLIAGGSISSSWVLLIGVVTLGTMLAGVLTIMQLSVTETIQQRIFTRSAFDFAYRIPKIKWEAIHGEYAPELVNRFFDTLTLQKGLPKILMDFSTSVLQIFFGLLLLSFYHPFFIFFGLLLIAVVLVIIRLTGPQGLRTSLTESKYKYEVAYWLEELARTMGTFKLAGASDLPLQKTDALVNGYLDARKAHFRVLVTQYSSLVGFKTLVTAGLLVLGSILVIDNHINIGQFVAAEIVIILVMASVEKLILTMETIYDTLTALDKLGGFTDLDIDREEGLTFEQFDTGKGIAVSLSGVTFRFPDSQQNSLDNFHLNIAAGEKLCVAGYNSSGKSTLLHLIAGVYTDFKGSLTFNGIPFRNLDTVSLRAHIGDHISQEDVFKSSLLENITMGHKGVSLQDAINAVELVGLSDFVKKLPEGYDTVLLPGGKNLPRNVISKIIFARCIASKPSLLAIEEPFDFLEKEDRERIAHLLTDATRNCTLVTVTDDALMAAKCDRIIILQNGRIVEDGSFDQIKGTKHFENVFKVG
jgi:ABC-type bacteriocin/lantibiotic exporter with double-glycine peptidase domain